MIKKWLLLIICASFPVLMSADVILKSTTGTFTIDRNTGAVKKIVDARGRTVLENSEIVYRFMSKAGDLLWYEKNDKTVKITEDGNTVVFFCNISKIPGLSVAKKFWIENNGLRRTLTFTNNSKVKYYVLPMADMAFNASFKQNVWHLGAGYIGPYKPLPHVTQERPVNEYRQSSKGMVLINNDSRNGSFSHYRVKINDTVVLPWWHSTIGHYREYDDRLYYTPKGYRMGLSTLDVLPNGGSISVTDCFNCFEGNLFTFFDDVFMADKEIASEIASAPAGPDWIFDIFTLLPMSLIDDVRYYAEMSSEGRILAQNAPFGDWCHFDYKNGGKGYQGGWFTGQEYLDYLNIYRKISPRVDPSSTYGIVIAAGWDTPIYKNNPHWFRKYDRAGREDSLFPGQRTNYQTMFNNVDLRDFLVKRLIENAKFGDRTTIYLDEAQMTNTIDWQRDQLTRDDHTVLFWKALKAEAVKNNIMLFFNGSGHHYADMQFIESPHDMMPYRWRDFAGMTLGLGMMTRCKPSMRMVPLYWSRKTDYVNRILALGWIPVPMYGIATFEVVRAVYQMGNSKPIDVKYTPDWKLDPKVEVESHAQVRDNSRDVLVSFINRAKKPADISITIDLTTVGVKKDTRINIWKISYVYGRPGQHFLLSDKEIKSNYAAARWNDGATMTIPQLVYSGNADKVFKDTLKKLGTDKMTSFLITTAPASVYSLDNMPQNSYYTVTRHGAVCSQSKTVDLRKGGEVLLIDLENEFYSVTCDGSNAETAVVDINGVTGLRVKVAPGKHTLDWKMRPRRAVRAGIPQVKVVGNDITTVDNSVIAVDRNHVNVYTGPTPVTLPKLRANGVYTVRYPGSKVSGRIKLYGGKGSAVPKTKFTFSKPEKKVRKVDIKHGDVTVSEAATFLDSYEDVYGSQRNLSPAVLKADPEKLTIVSGTSRRDGINLYHSAWAGLELNGAKQLKVRLSNTFSAANSIRLGHLRKGAGKPDKNFTGLIFDFSVNGKYTRRVAMSVGLYHPKFSRIDPPWGKADKVDLNLELGDFINSDPVKEFSLDLTRFAPDSWDGKVYVTVGTARILSNRELKLEIIGFNDADARDFLTPEIPAPAGVRQAVKDQTSTVLKVKPKSLKKIDPAEWEKWTKFERFQPYGFNPETILRSRTECYMAHDFEYIYLGIKAYEPTRKPIAKDAAIHRNERIEFLMVRPDNKVFQVITDVTGRNGIYINGMASELEGVISHAEYKPNFGTYIFMAIPIELLRFDMQRTPVIVKANICRARLGAEPELSVWSPMEKGFFETAKYGTLILHFD